MNPATMRLLRQVHTYLGVFFAPAILFFAFSGALQTFGLHENKGGGPYQPPAWIVTIASIHKNQGLPRPKRPRPVLAEGMGAGHGRPGHADKAEQGPPAPAHKPPPSPLPLKIFTLLLSIGLILTSLVGLYIALTNKALRRTAALVLAAGVVVPVVLLFL